MAETPIQSALGAFIIMGLVNVATKHVSLVRAKIRLAETVRCLGRLVSSSQERL